VKKIDWDGWRMVTVDLTTAKLAYPIVMKRIYVVSTEAAQEERMLRGEIAMDDITFQYVKEEQPKTKVEVKLTVNKKSLTIDGKAVSMDQAPVIVNNKTLVPVRFVAEAMGGTVSWEAQSRRIGIVKDSQMIEMWLGNPELNVDGSVVQDVVAPHLINDRTMVPLRLIAERLGWVVAWDGKTQSITLQ
jgi:hypothetical protein